IENVIAFLRLSRGGDAVVCVCNFSAAPRHAYRIGLPERGAYRLLLNTDSSYYSGSNALQINSIEAEEQPWQNRPFSAAVDLPPLTTLWFEAPKNNPGHAAVDEAKSSESGDAKPNSNEARSDA